MYTTYAAVRLVERLDDGVMVGVIVAGGDSDGVELVDPVLERVELGDAVLVGVTEAAAVTDLVDVVVVVGVFVELAVTVELRSNQMPKLQIKVLVYIANTAGHRYVFSTHVTHAEVTVADVLIDGVNDGAADDLWRRVRWNWICDVAIQVNGFAILWYNSRLGRTKVHRNARGSQRR